MDIFDRFRAWLNRNIVFVLVGLMLLSVGGNVVSSTFNASSLNNLTRSVSDIGEVQNDVSAGGLRTSCRTSVQADYDAALARIFMAAIVEDVPPEVLGSLPPEQQVALREFKIDDRSIANFADSVGELELLASGKICVGDDPVRADGSRPETPSDDIEEKK